MFYIGGGYIPDEDEDTCAIQLFDSNAATTAISAANGAIDGMAAAGNHRYIFKGTYFHGHLCTRIISIYIYF